MPSPLSTATAVVRRYLVLVAAVLLAASTLTLLAAAPARAAVSAPIGGITYSADPAAIGAGATATGYDGSQGTDVTIPDTVKIGDDDYSVTAIEPGAFSNSGLTSVNLPNALTSLGADAFSFNQLASVDLPDSLTVINDYAFYHNQLASVKLPAALTIIENGAFGYNSLPSATLPDTVTILGNGAFDRNKLTSVTLPDGLTFLGMGAFRDNAELTRVRFTGPVPAMIYGVGEEYPSLGAAPGPTVEFPARYLARDGHRGYTTPEWLGYSTEPAYTVSFDTHGGSTVDPVTAWSGEGLEAPSAPVREGHTFTGWFTTPELAVPFDFADAVGEDVTIHAGWKAISVPATPLTPSTGSLSGSSLDDFLPAGYGS